MLLVNMKLLVPFPDRKKYFSNLKGFLSQPQFQFTMSNVEEDTICVNFLTASFSTLILF